MRTTRTPTTRGFVRFGNGHKYVLLPCINAKMKEVGATNYSLAEQAGVSHTTVQAARNGKLVKVSVGQLMYQALNTRTFKKNMGRRGLL